MLSIRGLYWPQVVGYYLPAEGGYSQVPPLEPNWKERALAPHIWATQSETHQLLFGDTGNLLGWGTLDLGELRKGAEDTDDLIFGVLLTNHEKE